MTNSLLEALGTADARWAVIQANDRTTRYLRAGRGSAVLLLVRDADGTDFWPLIASHLAATHRVLVPEYPWEARELGDWVRGFLDGIGSPPVTILAATDLCLPALQVALAEPDRVAALVLLPHPLSDQTVVARQLSIHAERAHQTPLLILDTNAPLDDLLKALDAFLARPDGDGTSHGQVGA